MAAGKSSRINRQYKTKYRIRNWREYERGLRSRGDVTIWLSEDVIAAWIPPKNGLRGGQRRYSNLAIRTALTLRVVFGLPLRQTEEFLGVFQDFSLRSTTATFVYLPHFAVVRTLKRPSRVPRAACRAGTRATPPKTGGSCDPDSGTEFHTAITAPWGRSRPHLSLREGSETAPHERRWAPGGPGELSSSLRPRCSRPADATDTH